MHTLVLIRHGQSQWNLENRFTGWTDVPLSPLGIEEAIAGGKQLKEKGFTFDIAFTSLLKRAIKTLWLVQEEMDLMWLPVIRTWHLNERHYGALQGLNKAETAAKHGEEQVFIWRRSYNTPPPSLEVTDPRFPGNDPRYYGLSPRELPLAESLQDTVARTIPYWKSEIAPLIKSGKRLVIAAHGNSLRALVKHLDGISDEDITQYNIPTGIPLVYTLDKKMRAISKEYLGDPEAIKKAQQAVANQGKSE